MPLFVTAQVRGATAATLLFRWLVPSLPDSAKDILVPHSQSKPVRTYLFACLHNAGRSQMAAALFNMHVNSAECCAISAGTQPAAHVHPPVIEVMREIGIDLSSATPQKLTEELAGTASVLATMGCGEECPYIPGLRIVDWALPDPKGKSLDAVRGVRDEIHRRIEDLLHRECADCSVKLSELSGTSPSCGEQ